MSQNIDDFKFFVTVLPVRIAINQTVRIFNIGKDVKPQSKTKIKLISMVFYFPFFNFSSL
ncbi:MAG: hypothetical protein WKF36_11040 [Candidatus Nitrosocosmicus sp.]